MNNNQSYRESAIPEGYVLRTEYTDLQNEYYELKNERRFQLKRAGVRAAGFSFVAVCTALLLALVWWGGFKGTAWGNKARSNAEREALAYVSARHPQTTFRAYCSEPTGMGFLRCELFAPSQPPTVIYCDDDDAPYNDGCRTTPQPQ